MDEVDRVAGRVSLAAMAGLLGGVALATYKGHPLLKTSVSVAASCALVGTACFGFERLSNLALRQIIIVNNNTDEQTQQRVFYASHAIGGMIGGGITGALFQRRPLPGMALCVPLMVGVAYAEEKYAEERQERLRQLMATNNNKTDATNLVAEDSSESKS